LQGRAAYLSQNCNGKEGDAFGSGWCALKLMFGPPFTG